MTLQRFKSNFFAKSEASRESMRRATLTPPCIPPHKRPSLRDTQDEAEVRLKLFVGFEAISNKKSMRSSAFRRPYALKNTNKKKKKAPSLALSNASASLLRERDLLENYLIINFV